MIGTMRRLKDRKENYIVPITHPDAVIDSDGKTLSVKLAEKAQQSDLLLKADKLYVDTQIGNIGNSSPKGVYATLSSLQTAFPTGTTGIYVVTADGGWYYWNGSAWTKGGTYQSTGIADKSVTARTIDDSAIDYASSELANEHANLYNSAIETVSLNYDASSYGTLVDGKIIDKSIKQIKSVAIKMSAADAVQIGVGYLSGSNFIIYASISASVVTGVNIVEVDLPLDQTVDSRLVVFGKKLLYYSDYSAPNYGTIIYTSGAFNGTYAYTAKGNGLIFVVLNDVYYNLPEFATSRNQAIGTNDLGLLQLKINGSFVGNSVGISDFNSLKNLDFGITQTYSSVFPRNDMYIMNKVLSGNVVGISQVTIKSTTGFSGNPSTKIGIGYLENGSFTVTDFIEKSLLTNADNVFDVKWFTTPNKNNYIFVCGAFLYSAGSGVTSWIASGVTVAKNTTYSSLSVNNSLLDIGLSVSTVVSSDSNKPNNIITVGKSIYYDYQEIQDAVDNANDSVNNPVTILVYPGTYKRVELTQGTWNSRYINLIGINRDSCIIKDTSGVRATPPINANNTGIIKGFTIIATHDDITALPDGDFGSYAIHTDFGSNNLIIEDCTLISYQTAAIGAGLHQDGSLKIKNCDCKSLYDKIFNTTQAGDYPAILCHGSPTTDETNMTLVIDNCHCWTKDCTSALWTYKARPNNQMSISIYNTTAWSETSQKAVKVDLDCLTPDSYGNNVPTLNL